MFIDISMMLIDVSRNICKKKYTNKLRALYSFNDWVCFSRKKRRANLLYIRVRLQNSNKTVNFKFFPKVLKHLFGLNSTHFNQNMFAN